MRESAKPLQRNSLSFRYAQRTLLLDSEVVRRL